MLPTFIVEKFQKLKQKNFSHLIRLIWFRIALRCENSSTYFLQYKVSKSVYFNASSKIGPLATFGNTIMIMRKKPINNIPPSEDCPLSVVPFSVVMLVHINESQLPNNFLKGNRDNCPK